MCDLQVSLGVVGGWPAWGFILITIFQIPSSVLIPSPHFFPIWWLQPRPLFGSRTCFCVCGKAAWGTLEGVEYRLPCLAAWRIQHWLTLCFSEWVTARISMTPEGAAGFWGRCVFAGKGFLFWNWKEACRHFSGAGPALRTRLPQRPLEWQLTLAVGHSPQPFTNFPLRWGAERCLLSGLWEDFLERAVPRLGTNWPLMFIFGGPLGVYTVGKGSASLGLTYLEIVQPCG